MTRSPLARRPRRLALPVRLALLVAALGGAGAAAAQPGGAGGDAPPLGPDAVVSLVTVAPGDAVYSRFGHTGVRVRDDAAGLDVLFNYGTFAFDPLFAFRFAYGALDYVLSVERFPAALDHYRDRERRTVVEQRLNLTPAQRQALFDALALNARPENRTYRYDFLFDNCATRPRNAVERVLGPALRYAPAAPPGTFRDLIRPYVRPDPLLHLGTDLGLGLPVDRPATAREADFLPDHLFAAFARAEVRTPTGWAPLVGATDTLARRPAGPARPFPWPGALLVLAAAGVAAVTARDARGGGRRARPVLDGVVFGGAGVAGVVLVFLVAVSLHDVTRPNLHLLWAWPTHLLLASGRFRRGRFGRGYAAAALAGCALALGAWAVGPQHLPLGALPFVVLLGVRALALAAGPPSAPRALAAAGLTDVGPTG